MSITLNGASPETIFTSATMAGKNAVINGGMDIWQRGTSIALAASSSYTSNYNADRWQIGNLAASEACTVSRQATADTTNLPNIQYAMRVQRNSGQTGVGQFSLSQSIETVNSIPLAGKTVTLSFWGRAGANYSSASSALSMYLYSSTGTDGNVNSGAFATTPIATSVTLTTTWQRFTATATVATTSTQLAPTFFYFPVGTAGANDYFEITGVQLELGSVATTFSRAGGSIGGELALCQRYYQRTSLGVYVALGIGKAESATSMKIFFTQMVMMRTIPSVLDYGGSISVTTSSASASSLTIDVASPWQTRINATSTGMTAGQILYLYDNGLGTAYIGLSAEL